MRVPLGGLLGSGAFALLAYLALSRPDPQWTTILQNTYGALLLLMLIAGAASRGVHRSFAVGFAVASLAYLTAIYLPAFGLRDRSATHRALEMAHSHLGQAPQAIAFAQPSSRAVKATLRTTPVANGFEDPFAAPPKPPESEQPAMANAFYASGHMLWTLLAGFVGGILAGAIARSGERARFVRETE